MDTVILVHGFFRGGRNMRYLAQKLADTGYRVHSPTLPATFRSVDECAETLERSLADEFFAGAGAVHFVGHSMGGLVIRELLSRRRIESLGRVVLMGTPNGGSPYANLLLELPFSERILEALPDLAEPGPDIAPPLNDPAPQIGIIIGTKPDPVRRLLLPGEHDGLVTARSVRCVNAVDEICVPCPHELIHWRDDTADAVVSFLETGKFPRGGGSGD